jgi:hypothetical protein
MRFMRSRESCARSAALFLFFIILLQLSPMLTQGQNLGGTPATNKAVQGQTAAQPEGACLNLVNWVGMGAAWLMVSLNAGPLYVALTQTASALPFLVLALPAGANRRHRGSPQG